MCDKVKTKLFSLFVLFLLWATPAISSDDPYLDALKSEAEASAHVRSTLPLADAEEKQLSPDQEKIPLIQQQQQNEFYTKLDKELPATAKVYTKLNNHDKQKVVDVYLSSGKNMSAATQLLFKIYLKQKLQ